MNLSPIQVRQRNKISVQKWRKNNPEKYIAAARKSTLKYLYKISLEEYTRLLKQQNGVCAICKLPQVDKRKYLCVDHDHKTGKVRGLLCNLCNVGLGAFKDGSLFKEAEQYVNSFNKST